MRRVEYEYEGLSISQILVSIEIEIEIDIDPFPGWHLALMLPSNHAAKLCQHRNATRFLVSESHHASIHTAQLMSHRNVPPLPLAFLASWRLNSPAFTHPADRIEPKWTVHPAMADPIR
jgi:hypothetical protein